VKFKQLKITEITADNNIRSKISKESIEGLVNSIRETGILQPLLVKAVKEGEYNLIAGFRRITAAIEAGLDSVPCVIRDVSEDDREGIQLVENIQRENLNPIDEGKAVKQLVEKYNVEDAAMALGKSALYVDQRLKLLDLPTIVKQALQSRMISIGHGIVISRLANQKAQESLFKEILSDKMSVKQSENELERYATRLNNTAFDKTECKSCAHNGTNQGDLFDKDSELKGECLNKDCFAKKVKEHIVSRKKELKIKKVSTLTRNQYYDEQNEWTRLDGYSAEEDIGKVNVKHRMESCEDCAVIFDEENGNEVVVMKSVVYKSIKRKLAQLAKSKSKDGETKDNSRTLAKKANRVEETRRRFLIEKLEKKITNEQLYRIALEILFGNESGNDTSVSDFLAKHCNEKSSEDDNQNWSARWNIDVKLAKLDKKVIQEGILESSRRNIKKHDTEFLVKTASEIKIDMLQFKIDEEYLKKFTKDELVKVSKELKCAVPKDVQKKSKALMVTYILDKKSTVVPKELTKK